MFYFLVLSVSDARGKNSSVESYIEADTDTSAIGQAQATATYVDANTDGVITDISLSELFEMTVPAAIKDAPLDTAQNEKVMKLRFKSNCPNPRVGHSVSIPTASDSNFSDANIWLTPTAEAAIIAAFIGTDTATTYFSDGAFYRRTSLKYGKDGRKKVQ